MAHNFQIMQHPRFGEIRITDNNGHPWFIASDVAKALGYERPNDAVNTHCKKVNKISYGDSPQPYNIIPEADVYRLVMRSNLPHAEAFQDWVCEEVLPSIRKTGAYQAGHSKDDKTSRALATTLRALARNKAYTQERQAMFLAEAAHVLSGNPLENYLPLIADNRAGWLTPTALAGRLDISSNKLGRVLKKLSLHGEQDAAHQWSTPIWNKSPHCDRQVVSYLYNPDIVAPRVSVALKAPRIVKAN